jgi:P-aminobenzoate N-oxygenase AurF
MVTTAAATTTDQRIERLSALSLKRVIDPDDAIPGTIGPGQVLPDELLSVAGLDLGLTADQRAALSREEVAAVAMNGIRFEAVLTAGFSLELLRHRDLTDPRVTYILHEIGEETRHSRLFVRMIEQLAPKARNPFDHRLFVALQRRIMPRLMRRPAFFCVLVLTGEEIPDLFQKLASEHPETDPFIRAVNRYHRQEEARHLNFARILLPELWADATRFERWQVRHLAPRLLEGMFDMLVHPGVYEAAGLPGWKTWRDVNATPRRRGLKHEALRPVAHALIDAGALTPGRVPKAWQRLCGIDRYGSAV